MALWVGPGKRPLPSYQPHGPNGFGAFLGRRRVARMPDSRAWSRLQTVLPPPSRLLLHATSKLRLSALRVLYSLRSLHTCPNPEIRQRKAKRRDGGTCLRQVLQVSESTRQEDLAPADRSYGFSVIFSQALEEAAAGLIHCSDGGPLAA